MSILNHRVRFSDTDTFRVVYFAKYLEFTEAARAEYFRDKTGSLKELSKNNILFPVKHAVIDYSSPAYYDDNIIIETTIKEIGTTSITFLHIIKRDKTILAKTSVVVVCVDKEFKKKPIPENIKRQLQ